MTRIGRVLGSHLLRRKRRGIKDPSGSRAKPDDGGACRWTLVLTTLDRDPEFINKLVRDGRQQAQQFVETV